MDIEQLPVRARLNPLTSEHEAQIEEANQDRILLDDLIARIKKLGVDVSDAENRSALHKHVIDTLRSDFFNKPIGEINE